MEKKEMRDRLVQLCVKAYMFGSEQVIIDLPSLIGFVEAELDKAREEGYQKGLEESYEDYDGRLNDPEISKKLKGLDKLSNKRE